MHGRTLSYGEADVALFIPSAFSAEPQSVGLSAAVGLSAGLIAAVGLSFTVGLLSSLSSGEYFLSVRLSLRVDRTAPALGLSVCALFCLTP